MKCLLLSLLCVYEVLGKDSLRVAFQWKQLDFDFPSIWVRQDAINSGEFIPENNLPLGLEVYKDKLFVTVPRWKKGVAATLNYIKLSDPMDSPKLHPYPSWSAHKMPKDQYAKPPEIVSPFRIRADKCNRLWVVDTGAVDIRGDEKNLIQPQILVYDLRTDNLLRKYTIPKHQIREESFFANIAVEDRMCEDTFAYIGDLLNPALLVYSWKNNTSWRVKHHYFHIDPLAGDFNVSGQSFNWASGLFGISLSSPHSDGYSTLYFHPLTSTNEFYVSTRILRDPDLSKKSFHEFKLLGSRGYKGQSSVSFLDQKTGVLLYTLLNQNGIGCWRSTENSYSPENQGIVYKNDTTMVFPNDLKVDSSGNIWVLSDRLPTFLYSKLDQNDVNYRILTGPVKDSIKGSACDFSSYFNNKYNKNRNYSSGVDSIVNHLKYYCFMFLFVTFMF